eukprot:GCRY01008302.1.p1 GENE.GCRY01008302.1~~GCRY01008302.1.p1  ORF type:complete len:101 (+),score=2.61 GCRY01008302.1:35-304(+)
MAVVVATIVLVRIRSSVVLLLTLFLCCCYCFPPFVIWDIIPSFSFKTHSLPFFYFFVRYLLLLKAPHVYCFAIFCFYVFSRTHKHKHIK